MSYQFELNVTAGPNVTVWYPADAAAGGTLPGLDATAAVCIPLTADVVVATVSTLPLEPPHADSPPATAQISRQ